MKWRVPGTAYEGEAPAGAAMPRGAVAVADGRVAWVHVAGETWRLEKATSAPRREADAEHRLEAPMPGRVAKVFAKPGDAVRKGTTLLVLEAMKMEHEIRAPYDGVVRAVRKAAGEMVALGDALADVDPESGA